MNKRLEDVGDTLLGAPESLAGGGVVRVWQESDVSRVGASHVLVRGLQSHDDLRGGDAVDVSPEKESESSLRVGQCVVLGGCWDVRSVWRRSAVFSGSIPLTLKLAAVPLG